MRRETRFLELFTLLSTGETYPVSVTSAHLAMGKLLCTVLFVNNQTLLYHWHYSPEKEKEEKKRAGVVPGVCLCLSLSFLYYLYLSGIWRRIVYFWDKRQLSTELYSTRTPKVWCAHYAWKPHTCHGTDPCQYVPFLSVPGPCPPPSRRTTSYRYSFFSHVGARTTVDVWTCGTCGR